MVKHIVCYKFKDNSRENLDRATAALLSMRFNVPQVLSVEAGADFAGSARSYDLALAVTLKSREDLEEYQTTPERAKKPSPYGARFFYCAFTGNNSIKFDARRHMERNFLRFLILT